MLAIGSIIMAALQVMVKKADDHKKLGEHAIVKALKQGSPTLAWGPDVTCGKALSGPWLSSSPMQASGHNQSCALVIFGG